MILANTGIAWRIETRSQSKSVWLNKQVPIGQMYMSPAGDAPRERERAELASELPPLRDQELGRVLPPTSLSDWVEAAPRSVNVETKCAGVGRGG